MKVIIVGGGASGCSCAARLRRLDEKAEITILEKTSEISIASCGLPYFVGEIITERSQMQILSKQSFETLFNIDIYLNTEVCKINTSQKTITTGDDKVFCYDKLVLATGAKPILPHIDGLDNIPHFVLKNLNDADKIKEFITRHKPSNIVVVGGGFIGLEIAENLAHLGIKISLIELNCHVLPTVDSDIAAYIHQALKTHNIDLYLSKSVQKTTENSVILSSGEQIQSDCVILALGQKPATSFEIDSELKTNEKGSILTDEFMQTSIKDIYACGDNIVVQDFVSGKLKMTALAGPANRQGRLIASHICKQGYTNLSIQGSGIIKVFDLCIAFTGANESLLKQSHISYQKMIIASNSHAAYYPNASKLTLKVLYAPDGKILGAQAVGKEGVDKRIDIIASIMHMKGTISDLRDAELCYAPPFSSAKDPINLIGMAIENARNHLFEPYFEEPSSDMIILDVRPEKSYKQEHIKGAINIPAAQIRARLQELDKNKTIFVYCFKGYTSYLVSRILILNGFKNVLSYAGGYEHYKIQKQNI